MKSTTIIAFDQHAATTVAAVLLPAHRTAALHSLASDSPTILRFIERLRRQGPVTCCYEAGPCGFELQRALSARDIPCEVIAPALIPRRPGDRIKTDRRDAGHLAILYRAGALTAIHIPTEQEEAARDLLRCREDIRADLLRARHRLSKFLLRHGRLFSVSTQRFAGDKKGRVRALQANKVEMVRKDGRLEVVAVPESDFEIKTDLVLLAMGFTGAERGPLLGDLGVTVTPRGNVGRDQNWMTNVPGVFTAGDMQRGQSLIVWAIAEGRSAARAIDQYLMGESQLPAPLQ